MAKNKDPIILGYGSSFGLPIGKVWGSGLKPIHCAALKGRIDCLRLCIEKQGVDINIKSGDKGWCPIHLCISDLPEDATLKCVKYLLQKGAEPNCVNNENVTPLHLAATWGQLEVMKILVGLGVDIYAVDIRGHTPMDTAKLWNQPDCARFLFLHEWNMRHFAKDDNIKIKDEDILKFMQEYGETPQERQRKFQLLRTPESSLNSDQKPGESIESIDGDDDLKEVHAKQDKHENESNSGSKSRVVKTQNSNHMTVGPDLRKNNYKTKEDVDQSVKHKKVESKQLKQKPEPDRRSSQTKPNVKQSTNPKTVTKAKREAITKGRDINTSKTGNFDSDIDLDDEIQKEYLEILSENGLQTTGYFNGQDKRTFLKFSKENVKDTIAGW